MLILFVVFLHIILYISMQDEKYPERTAIKVSSGDQHSDGEAQKLRLKSRLWRSIVWRHSGRILQEVRKGRMPLLPKQGISPRSLSRHSALARWETKALELKEIRVPFLRDGKTLSISTAESMSDRRGAGADS